jgi:putative component of toxin-antitoxin plasmid stabilization module
VAWKIEFYADDGGRQPAREWLQSLEPPQRAAAIAAIEIQLAEIGLDVCATEHGKQLGEGLFEFRIRHDEGVTRRKAGQEGGRTSQKVLLRIFCHAYGDRIVLLLGGYDKGADASARRQRREIDTARRRLRSFRLARKRRSVGDRRRRG